MTNQSFLGRIRGEEVIILCCYLGSQLLISKKKMQREMDTHWQRVLYVIDVAEYFVVH